MKFTSWTFYNGWKSKSKEVFGWAFGKTITFCEFKMKIADKSGNKCKVLYEKIRDNLILSIDLANDILLYHEMCDKDS